jgi:quinol monooxygenase YgiN
MIGIVAKLRVKPDRAEEFAAQTVALTKVVAAKEPGCVFYDLYRTDDPAAFVALELYETQADVDAHGASDHVAETMKTVPDMLDGDMDVDILKQVY